MTLPFAIPVLQTDRLILRGPHDSDAPALGAFLESPRAAWIGGPYPATDAPDWLMSDRRRWKERGRGSWIVALGGRDTPIGRVGILDHEGWNEPELAWFLFAGFEGLGYAHEAALAARNCANTTMGLPPLFSFIGPANLRSKALVERLGAVPERDVQFKGLDLRIYRHPAPAGAA
jgi:RimJ/RimL family protein N-acetyltransferase